MIKLKIWKLVFLILIIFLTACQDNSNASNEVTKEMIKEVTTIEVVTWNENEFVTTIEDKKFIEELVKALVNAETYSTKTIDWAGPDYKLLFKRDSEVLYEIGYCKTTQNFGDGATGRYWEFDKLYEVDIKLPLN